MRFNLGEFLQSTRGRWALISLIVSGLVSVALGLLFPTAEWGLPVQILLVLSFVLFVVLLYVPPDARLRILAGGIPALGAVLLGMVVLPQWLGLFIGLAVGWMVAAWFLFRQQTPRELTRAIRAMRKGDYDNAIAEMDTLIRIEKTNPEHYRLRAIIFSLASKHDRAKRDYEKMLALAESTHNTNLQIEAWNGLSEINLQARHYEAAYEAAQRAHQLYPENWIPLYNLGLIGDRLARSQAVIDHLQQALKVGITDVRQRLLSFLYLARAYNRTGDVEHARLTVKRMENLWSALENLEKLLKDEQSAPLAAIIADDVKTARALMIDELDASQL